MILSEWCEVDRARHHKSRDKDTMRKFVIPALTTVVLAASTAMPTPATAAHALSGTWSADSIKAHCDAAGGSFNTQSNGGYNCATTKGAVQCDKDGKCSGTDPAALGGGPKKPKPVPVGGMKHSPSVKQ